MKWTINAAAAAVMGLAALANPASATISGAHKTAAWAEDLDLPPGIRLGNAAGFHFDGASGQGWLHSQPVDGEDLWVKNNKQGCLVTVRAEGLTEVTSIGITLPNSLGIAVASETAQRAAIERLLHYLPKNDGPVFFHPKSARRYVIDFSGVKGSFDAIGPFNKYVFYVSGGLMGAVVAFYGRRFDSVFAIDMVTSGRFSRNWSNPKFRNVMKKTIDDSQRSSFD